MTARGRRAGDSRHRVRHELGNPGGGAPAFTPLSLASPQLLLHLGDTSTLRQDAAGTTAVTSDGDPIGRATDQSPAARVYTAAGIVRPLYRTSAMAGLACGQCDGTDDVLTATAAWTLPGAQTWTFDYQLTSLPGSGTVVEVAQISDGTTASLIYLANHASYQSLTWLCAYGSSVNSVGWGGLSGAGLDLLRHRVVLTYSGAGTSTPGSYTLTVDGVARTVVASGVFNLIGAGASIGASPASGTPLPGRLRKIAVHGVDHSGTAGALANLDTWANG